ncbi:Acg family FMN-binding oxidoreductase [Saccharopolyspora phatthalungensis]|uniref:Nitroreductase n=1 Tax=Saccharopolyspora phatthalungensis TaxID=664693 RepID=A0A840QFQ8_9PSEU|nr:nitroreductase family protein [Saccharopolyspora phatthalungensis]MBB5157568.1 nitroreductase [Saccharopolyspora phatthalungensis]
MGRSVPSQETMRSALALACRAPSVHNSQPWRWKLAEHSVHLYLDRSRLLGVIDPTGREMVISCGAVLNHARIAFAGEGWQARVHWLPNPAQPEHLASIEFRELTEVDPHVETLAAAAADRRSDRRPFLTDPVPQEVLAPLREVARVEDCTLTFALEDRERRELELAIEHAGSEERQRPEYREELAAWAGRHASPEGVPVRSIPAEHLRGMPERDFALAAEGELAVPILDDGAVLAVLSTRGDTYDSWLATGEALSAVLLSATEQGLATCPLSQIAEVAESRNLVREQILGGSGYPQMAIRIGWPVTREFPGPLTPRRPVSEFVEPLFPKE